MTISYSLDVASSTFCGIHKLLFRWNGSIWKSIWPELLLWLTAYASLSALYRFVLENEHRRIFEDLSVFFYTYGDYIPLTFMLGFYVSAIFTRWSSIFDNLGWVDSPSLLIATAIKGHDETARNIRRNIVRYMVLLQAIVFRDISTCVKKRFPTMDHLVTAGFMTANELREYDAIESPQLKYWIPVNWIFLLVRKARELQLIDSDIIYVDILDKIRQYRINILTLTVYDWVPVPLVYTQVVNLAVRTYFVVALLGRQYLVPIDRDLPTAKTIDLYFPIMTVFQFLFYIGWMKVAEVMLNPLGDDDDDFECNWILDRNLQVGFAIVDDACGRLPKLEKDVFWNDICPEPLYTAESANRPHNPMIGSCNDLTGEEAAILQPPKRRLMSAGTINPMDLTAFNRSGEVLVRRHNPSKKSYGTLSDNQNVQNERNRFLASFKRKIGRGNKRSNISNIPFAETIPSWNLPPNGVPKIDVAQPEGTLKWNSSFSRQVFTRNVIYWPIFSDSYSSSFVDGLQTPFAQSSPSNIWGRKNSDNSIDPTALNTRLEQIGNNQEDIYGGWTVNELLPVIQEENEQSRKSTMMNGIRPHPENHYTTPNSLVNPSEPSKQTEITKNLKNKSENEKSEESKNDDSKSKKDD